MRTKRIDLIERYIEEEKLVSLDVLCEKFAVSKNTIRRDIEALTLTYPIETHCGRYHGGVRMAEWYYPDRRRLTPRQEALLRRLAADLQGEDLEDINQILIQFAS